MPKPPHAPGRPPSHHRHPHRHVPSSAIASFVNRERIAGLLSPWVSDPEERAFVVRCLLDEGPAHHRGANYVLLALLGQLVAEGGPVTEAGGPARPVPMRLPPHLAEDRGDEGTFPLGLPTAPLERLAAAGSAPFEAMVDCLTDGPPQHSLANTAMVCLLGVLLDRQEKERR